MKTNNLKNKYKGNINAIKNFLTLIIPDIKPYSFSNFKISKEVSLNLSAWERWAGYYILICFNKNDNFLQIPLYKFKYNKNRITKEQFLEHNIYRTIRLLKSLNYYDDFEYELNKKIIETI